MSSLASSIRNLPTWSKVVAGIVLLAALVGIIIGAWALIVAWTSDALPAALLFELPSTAGTASVTRL